MTDLNLHEFLPYRLNNVAERVEISLSRIYMREFGINIAEWRVLATLHQHRTTLARDIAHYTHMDKVRVSRAVSHLEEKGCVEKRRSQRDSRAVELMMTRKGRELYKAVVPVALDWQRTLLSELSEIDRQELLRILGRLDKCIDSVAQFPDAAGSAEEE